MDAEIEHALKNDSLIDITTVGRKTGTPKRIEIAFHNFDGTLYISGMPGKRDWYANLAANPQFTFHLKQSTQADLPARAIPITDEAARRQVLSKVVAKWNQQDKLEADVCPSIAGGNREYTRSGGNFPLARHTYRLLWPVLEHVQHSLRVPLNNA